MEKKKLYVSKTFLVIFLILIFYIILIAYSNFYNFAQNFSQFKLEYLIPILSLYLLGIFFLGIRQQSFFKTIGISIPFKKNILLLMAGYSMEATPAGFGKLIKSYYLEKKFGYSISKSFPVFFIERFYDLLALTTIIAFFSFYFQIIEITIIILFVVFLLSLVYATIHSKNLFNFFIKIIGRIPLINKLIIPLSDSQEIFKILTEKNLFIKNWSLSIVSLSIFAVSIYLVFVAFNVDLNIIYTTFITFSSLLFGALSLLPAGIGITEISLVGFLTKEGLDLSLATSIMIMIRLSSIWFVTILGFISTKLFLK